MRDIVVKKITDTSLLVGSKVVYKTNDNWRAVSDLSQREREAFEAYLIENKEL